jgi:hypothetical protein
VKKLGQPGFDPYPEAQQEAVGEYDWAILMDVVGLGPPKGSSFLLASKCSPVSVVMYSADIAYPQNSEEETAIH